MQRIQEQSAVTDFVNPPFSVTAGEGVDSFSVSEEVALNTSSTSTSSSAPMCNQIPSSSSTSTIRDDKAVLTKRMMQTPLPEHP